MQPTDMRVLLISDMSKVGGTEIATYINAKQLHSRVDYVGVLGKSGPLSQDIAAFGIDNFDAVSHTKNPVILFKYLLKLCKVIQDNNINIIHAQMARPIPLVWLAKILLNRKDLKIFWTSRGLAHNTYRYIVPMFERMQIRGVGNCKMEQQKLIRYGYQPVHTNYLYNAYRLNPITAVRVKPTTPPYVIGTLSALRDDRRVDLFINMAAELVKDPNYGHQVTFLIGGEGSEQPKLESLVKKYGLSDKVTFCGNITDIESFMQQLHVFVSPIIVEGDSGAGVSNAIIEAMVTKTPVCAYDASAIGEIVITGFTGYLIEAGNNIALVQAVTDTLNNPTATSQRIENAYDLIIDQCDPNNFSNKLIAMYGEM